MDKREAESFKLLTISVEKLPASMARQEEANRYAAERSRLLLGCYRTGEANDPDTYVAAITAVLARYPLEVITSVTHPVSGLAGQSKWLPTVQEVREACERAVLPMQSHQARQKRIAEQMEARRLEDEARKIKPTYDQMKAKYGPDWGIARPSAGAVDPEADMRALQRTQRAMLAEYAGRGIEPKYNSMGDLISPSLVRQIEAGRELEQHIDRGFSPGSV